jgi:large repetitive protein
MNVPQAGTWKGKGLWVWLLTISAVAAAILALQAAPAAGQQANKLVVDDDKVQCTDADYTSIQEAVDNASPDTLIRVCAGTYEEQVTFGEGKDDIVLDGAGRDSTKITAPDDLTSGDLVAVNGATNITIRDFLISGPFPQTGCTDARGVRVFGGGSAVIANNRITEIRSEDPSLRGCQNGIAVVYGDYDPGSGTSTSGTGTVLNNVIDRYQKGGIIVSEADSNATIRDNTILGVGATEDIAQNGIQVSYGGQATVRQNGIRDNRFTGATDDQYDAGGIILFKPDADTLVGGNIIARNDYNIGLFNADGIAIRSNRATNGKDLAGIFVNARSTDNLFRDNRALGNERLDCWDRSEGTGTSGTANTWIDNIGETDRPSGICNAP